MADGWTGVSLLESGRHLFACPEKNCFRRLTFKTLEQATNEERIHSCPWWGGESKVSWSVARTLVEQMWEKLDEVMDQIKTEMDNASMIRETELKARGRAIAECLALFMPPFFEDANSIAAEAQRRYKARAADDSEYETPGIGHRRYETAAQWHATRGGFTSNPDMVKADDRKAARTRTASRPASLDAQTETAIKFALESGMMSEQDIARMYKISVEQVQKLKTS